MFLYSVLVDLALAYVPSQRVDWVSGAVTVIAESEIMAVLLVWNVHPTSRRERT